MYARESFAAVRRCLEGYLPTRIEALETAYFQGDAPCGMLIDEIEALWDGIAERDDWSGFEAKVAAVRAMGVAYGRGEGA
jgi:hypothetical protein